MQRKRASHDGALEALIQDLVHEKHADCTCVRLPRQLERSLYETIDRLLRYAGGRWDRHKEAHVFAPDLDTRAAIKAAFDGKAHIDDNPADFFPTPGDVADEIADLAIDDYMRFCLAEHLDLRIRVLEPSAGRGNLIEALFRLVSRDQIDLVAFEIDPRHTAALARIGVAPRQEDFLSAPAGEPVDLVVMNPPFAVSGRRDGWAAHVQKALAWLKPGGRLLSIVPASIENCATRREADPVLDLVAQAHAYGEIGQIRDLAFAGNGKRAPNTPVSTRLLMIETPTSDRNTPHNGWSNQCTFSTALIIDNNNERLRDEAIFSGKRSMPTSAEIEMRLATQRAAWIHHGAPWIAGSVNVREIADHLCGTARDILGDEGPCQEAERDDPRKVSAPSELALPLFSFASRYTKAA